MVDEVGTTNGSESEERAEECGEGPGVGSCRVDAEPAGDRAGCDDGCDEVGLLDASEGATVRVERLAGRPIRVVVDHAGPRTDDGPVVVLMPGAAASSDFWAPVMEFLPDLDVVSYDRPGLGGTPWPGRLPRLDEEVDSLVDLLSRVLVRHSDVGGRRAVLVAHSMAAFHAEALTRSHPELVDSVVLVDPSVEWPTHPPRRRESVLPGAVDRLMRWGLRGPGRALFSAGVTAQSVRAGTGVWHQFREHRLHDVYGRPEAMAMAVAEWIGYDWQAWDLMNYRRRYPWPGVPTILLSAVHSGQEQELALHERLAPMLGARLVVVDDSHHLMMLDRPEVIEQAIRSVADR